MTTKPPLSTSTQPLEDSESDVLEPFKTSLQSYFPTSEDIFERAEQRKQLRRRAKKAASALTVCAMFVSLWWWNPAYKREQFATDIGEQQHMELIDGSLVTLNTNTVLQIEWHLRSRHLKLQQGEASFHVAHGPRPFIVDTNATQIRDIGTVFNVRTDPHNTLVTVQEGAVELHTGNAVTVLTINQGATVEHGNVQSFDEANTGTATAWQRGKLVFDGTPLAHAVVEMQRYRKAPIIIGDDQIAALRLSGEFDSHRIDALLDLLPSALPVALQRQADGRVVLLAAATVQKK